MDKTKFINVIVGDIEVPEKMYLMECCITETLNQSIIFLKIDDILRKLDIARENFLLLLSDAASYMTACTATLKVLYPRLFHVTCLAQMRTIVWKKVCGAFADVDNLIARVKVATIKNKSRQAQFKHIGSPPEPVVTRWGTWLKAADYYADNLIEGDGILELKKQ